MIQHSNPAIHVHSGIDEFRIAIAANEMILLEMNILARK